MYHKSYCLDTIKYKYTVIYKRLMQTVLEIVKSHRTFSNISEKHFLYFKTVFFVLILCFIRDDLVINKVIYILPYIHTTLCECADQIVIIMIKPINGR